MAWYRVNTVEIEENWNCGHYSDYNHQYIGLYTEPKETVLKVIFAVGILVKNTKILVFLLFINRKAMVALLIILS